MAPQLTEADFPAARAAGIKTIINNRPDGEAADQLTDAEARALAQANGLAYVFVPWSSERHRARHDRFFRGSGS